MQMVVLVLYLLLSTLFGLAHAGDNFWREVSDLVENHDAGGIRSFFETGWFPSEVHAAQHPVPQAFQPVYNPHHPHPDVFPSYPVTAPDPRFASYLPSPGSEPGSSSLSSGPYHPTIPEIRQYVPRREVLPSVLPVRSGRIILPPSLSIPERQTILEEAKGKLYSFRPRLSSLDISTLPFSGKQLTPGLAREAMGSWRAHLLEYNPGYFVVPGSNDGVPNFARKDGNMITDREAKYHMYIWKRYEIPGQSRLAFQLVGMLESKTITTRSMLSGLKAYKTGHGSPVTVGDWVSVIGKLKLVKNSNRALLQPTSP
ncbi:uncharacterized protein UBRO_03786 [Ustilago bromivora]|uniref:Uncharacterized protein n=1 Tax=Ustilago bromivora TaxID=307758 RepID=A0A1K0GWA9_9BASI|nr:uncharacterized protein UBRO_03786 [Ustilago bromivora]